MNSLKGVYISTEQQCMLFDSMVGSFLSCASEIWGFHRAHDIATLDLYNKICNQYFKILKRLEIYIGKWPSSPYKKAVGTFFR
jgi:hypothetical protein